MILKMKTKRVKESNGQTCKYNCFSTCVVQEKKNLIVWNNSNPIPIHNDYNDCNDGGQLSQNEI